MSSGQPLNFQRSSDAEQIQILRLARQRIKALLMAAVRSAISRSAASSNSAIDSGD